MDEDTIKWFMHGSGQHQVSLSKEDVASGLPGYELVVTEQADRYIYELRRVRTPTEKVYDAARDYALNQTDGNWLTLVAARAAIRPVPSGSEVRER